MFVKMLSPFSPAQGCRKGGIQESRDAGRRDAGKEGCRKEGARTGGILDCSVCPFLWDSLREVDKKLLRTKSFRSNTFSDLLVWRCGGLKEV